MKRSKWKGLFVNLKLEVLTNFKKTRILLPQSKSDKSKRVIQLLPIMSRNFSILPIFIGSTFRVHNGKNLKKILVKEEMVDHKFGEFAKTRSEFVFKKKKKKKKT